MKHSLHPKLRSLPTLGVDIGRVIIDGDGPDTSFIGGTDEDAMRARAMPGAFESLARLTLAFEGRVHIVSKCGPRIQARSRAWLDLHDFWTQTGIDRRLLHFCRKRNEKAPICLEHGIGYFVDDRVDVLVPMAGIVRHRYLFGQSSSPDAALSAVPTWAAAERAISSALEEELATGGRTPEARAP